MWDSNALLKLIKSMPKKLSKENLEKIQLVIDADKYKNSLICGFDLCGMYAPICRDCKKTSIYPCAVAYVNMLKADGMDIEIDAKPVTGKESAYYAPEQVEAEKYVEDEEKTQTVPAEEAVSAQSVDIKETADEAEAEESVPQTETALVGQAKEENNSINKTPEKAFKRKIRIAVARKKI